MSGKRKLSLGTLGVAIAVLAVAAAAAALLFSLRSDDDGNPSSAPAKELSDEPNVVAADLQAFWASTFESQTRTYEPAKFAPLADAGAGGCKQLARNAVSFYCAADQTLYLDGPFLEEVQASGGTLAQAYVVAHLFGHHVQQVLGITEKVLNQQLDKPARAPLLNRQIELEADCLGGYGIAGVTGAGAPASDEFKAPIESVQAAAEGGVKQQAGVLNAETWENGPAADQVEWIDRGLALTDVASCDTFSGAVPEEAPR